jgi:hypothetical protein
MDKDTVSEIVIGVILVLLFLVFLNPFNLWMPEELVLIMLAAMVFLVILFGHLVWREHQGDERERFHKIHAGRFGYLVGLGVIGMAIIVEGVAGSVDPWLIVSIGAMIAAKIMGLLYNRTHH